MDKSTARIIAVAGKGGVGKTSLSAAMVRCLTERYPGRRILAIDADPAVGLEVGETLDGIRRRVSEEVAARAGGAVGDILAGVSDALRAAMLHPAG